MSVTKRHLLYDFIYMSYPNWGGEGGRSGGADKLLSNIYGVSVLQNEKVLGICLTST